MNSSSENRHRSIRIACAELEHALRNFEDDSEASRRSREEAERLSKIKIQLDEIKRQLDSLSD